MDFFSYGDVAPKPHVHDFKYPLEDFGLALEKTRIITTSKSLVLNMLYFDHQYRFLKSGGTIPLDLQLVEL